VHAKARLFCRQALKRRKESTITNEERQVDDIKSKTKNRSQNRGPKKPHRSRQYSAAGKPEKNIKKGNKDRSDRPEYKTPEQLIEERSEFQEAVKKELAQIRTTLRDTTIRKELQKGRRDLRKITVVTIDSEETKDVDDGISIERLQNGHYLLGVHIADVAHYVKEETALDREAYERGTSVYLVDKVLPMLPQKLSNGICSLNVGEDRLALTVMMTIDSKGQIRNHEIFESIICVKYKITYKQIFTLFEGDQPPYRQAALREEFAAHYEDLRMMKELAALRHAMRYKRGSIDFDFPETHVTTDQGGSPVSIETERNTFANNIIEEFMLAANETVAEHFSRINVPFLYRVHGRPETEKICKLSTAIRSMGYTLKGNGAVHAHAIQSLLETVKGKAAEPIISMLTLRAMQKAEYSPENQGHFGLAAENYTHFTSPIRRYPDLFIHRVIKDVFHGKMTPARQTALSEITGEAAKHCSETEREAENAERTYTDRLVAEYMNRYIGDTFDGTICNITSFGIFVRLENSAEGLVFYNSMPDYMIFDEKKMIASGERNKRRYAIGDPVNVKVVNCNVKMGQIEFHFTK